MTIEKLAAEYECAVSRSKDCTHIMRGEQGVRLDRFQLAAIRANDQVVIRMIRGQLLILSHT